MRNLYLWLIPILPLIGAALNGLIGKRLPKTVVAAIALLFTAGSFAWVLMILPEFRQMQLPHLEHYGTWITAGDFSVEFGAHLDQLSLVMLLVVTGVGFLIHIYSVGYMWEDPGFYRFFSYLNLFMFFMLTLVLANNYLLMFVGWEGVGLASYLLIGFFFNKPSAAQAGKKAFITNRVGDFAFLLGMFLLILHFGTLNYVDVTRQASALGAEHGWGPLSWIGLLFLIGATGKSAQIPLYVWLPDAMEGPTPVSALIHAATMVTAGVYMIARSNAIFNNTVSVLMIVAVIGALTSIFAATIGIVQFDIKRVLAYSTISQLGYMFLACGVAAYAAAIFHLMTHAFFKALLFLGSGSVIHGLGGEQDMRRMGGLRKDMPWTFWTMTVGTFAIAGFPLFAGFFSKDMILWNVFNSEHAGPVLWTIGIATAFMTSFYMFRLWFMTFFGERRADAILHDAPAAVHAYDADTQSQARQNQARQDVHAHAHGHEPGSSDHSAHGHGEHGHGHPHESPMLMLAPLFILALLSIVGGYVGLPHVLGHDYFTDFLNPVLGAHGGEHEGASLVTLEWTLMFVSLAAFLGGLVLAWLFYGKRSDLPVNTARRLGGLYRLVRGKYFVDEAYYATLVDPIVNGSRNLLWRGVDVSLIDAAVNSAGSGSQGVSRIFRRMQSGNIRSYAGWVALGAAAVIGYMIWLGASRADAARPVSQNQPAQVEVAR